MFRRILGLSIVVILLLGFVASEAQAAKLTVIVVADLTGLDLVPTAGGGPFYIPGTLWDPDSGEQIGVFHCWGFFILPDGSLGVVNQEFDLTGRGKIILTGVEDEGPRAITGGTGDFRNVRGEATGIDLSEFPVFPVTFELIGGGGGKSR